LWLLQVAVTCRMTNVQHCRNDVHVLCCLHVCGCMCPWAPSTVESNSLAGTARQHITTIWVSTMPCSYLTRALTHSTAHNSKCKAYSVACNTTNMHKLSPSDVSINTRTFGTSPGTILVLLYPNSPAGYGTTCKVRRVGQWSCRHCDDRAQTEFSKAVRHGT
jgi:hypothetical protein